MKKGTSTNNKPPPLDDPSSLPVVPTPTTITTSTRRRGTRTTATHDVVAATVTTASDTANTNLSMEMKDVMNPTNVPFIVQFIDYLLQSEVPPIPPHQQQPPPTPPTISDHHPLYSLLFPSTATSAESSSTVPNAPTKRTSKTSTSAATTTVTSTKTTTKSSRRGTDTVEPMEMSTAATAATTTIIEAITATTATSSIPNTSLATSADVVVTTATDSKKSPRTTTTKKRSSIPTTNSATPGTNARHDSHDTTGSTTTEQSMNLYWLYLSIHCCHTLIDQLTSISHLDATTAVVVSTPKPLHAKSHTAKKKKAAAATATAATGSSIPVGKVKEEHPSKEDVVQTTRTMAMIMIWLSYAVTTKLLRTYWYDHHHHKIAVTDTSSSRSTTMTELPDVTIPASNTMEPSNTTGSTEGTTSSTTTTNATMTTTNPPAPVVVATAVPGSTITKQPRIPKLSQFGKHLIGQLLVVLSQITTTALTILTTTSISDDDSTNHGTSVIDSDSSSGSSTVLFRQTIFVATVVLDYVTCETNSYPNMATTATTNTTTQSSLSPTSTTSATKDDAEAQYSFWKQQSLAISISIPSLWRSIIRPVLSNRYERLMAFQQSYGIGTSTTDWTLMNDCYNELVACVSQRNSSDPSTSIGHDTTVVADDVLAGGRKFTASSLSDTTSATSKTTITPTLAVVRGRFVRLLQQQPSSSQSLPSTCARLDSRTTIKRWSSMALVWYRPGQEQLLQCAYNLLLDSAPWVDSDYQGTDIPSNMVWMTTICRICDIVHSIGQTAGKSAPTTQTNSSSHNIDISYDSVDAIGDDSTGERVTITTSSTGSSSTAGYDVYVKNLVAVLWAATANVAMKTRADSLVTTQKPTVKSTIAAAAILSTSKVTKKSKKKDKQETSQSTVVSSATTPVSTTTKQSMAAKLHRTDVCDYVMVVSYHLLQRHYQCMNKIYSQSPTATYYGVVVNSDTADVEAIDKSTICSDIADPYLAVTLSNLAISAAANATNGTGNQSTQQRIFCDRIEYMTASWIFMMQESYSSNIDVCLSLYAITKFLTCLENKNIKNEANDISLPELKLDEPLPTPTLQSGSNPVKEAIVSAPSRKRRKTTNLSSDASSSFATESNHPSVQNQSTIFAGMYDMVVAKPAKSSSKKPLMSLARSKSGSGNTDHSIMRELTSAEKLALYSRALNGRAEKLIHHFIWMVESCCHEQNTNDDLHLELCRTDVPPTRLPVTTTTIDPTHTKKRKNVDSTKTMIRKRQKRDNNNLADDSMNGSKLSQTLKCRRLDGRRTKLVTDVFNVLRLLLQDEPNSTSHVLSYFRRSIVTDHLFRVVDLGVSIAEMLLHAWHGAETRSLVTSPREKDLKTLWSTVMNLNISVGKTYSKIDTRIELFEKVAKLCKVRSSVSTAWPLWLGLSSRVLVTASLVYSSTSNAADLFIVNGIVTELQHVAAKWDIASTFEVCKTVLEVPLSIYDARVFLVAFSKLPSDSQKVCLVSLLSTTETILKKVCLEKVTNKTKVKLSLVGRLVTLCSNTYCMIRLGASFRDKLLAVVTKHMTVLTWAPDRSVYSELELSINRYMGVFDDWESSDLPLLSIPSTVPDLEDTSMILQRLLESSLKLGFLSAPIDSCHILFASWNELGKRDLWLPVTSHISPFTILPNDLSSIVIQLRDEMCYAHSILKRFHQEDMTDSTLTRVVKDRHGCVRNCESAAFIKKILSDMIDKAVNLVDAILDSFSSDEDCSFGRRDPVKFCLLEACTVYASFVISSFSRPTSDFFTTTHLSFQSRSRNRTRGYSTDSDALEESDAGSEDSHDLVFATIGRMHEVCDTLGASPAHPDWLDDDCHLLESVSANEGAQIALKALKCMTKLLGSGLMKSQIAIRCAFGKLQEGKEKHPVDILFLTETLCLLKYYSSEHSHADIDSEVGSLLGKVCGLDSSVLHSRLVQRSTKTKVATDWYPYSSHRIQGKLQGSFRNEFIRELNNEELKLCGEWEIMLSSMLSSASINDMCDEEKEGLDRNSFEYASVSEHWFVVCETALSSLVPAAALLRFCVFSSGRLPHPLSFIEKSVHDFEKDKFYVSGREERNLDVIPSESFHEAIVSTLAVAAHFSSHRTSNAIANRLVIEPAAFYSLQCLVGCATAFQAIEVLQEALKFGGKEALFGILVLMKRAALILEHWGSDTNIIEMKHVKSSSSLVACLHGYDYKKELRFKTILFESIDPIEALSKTSVSLFLKWDWSSSHFNSINCIVNSIFGDLLADCLETRSFLAYTIARVVTTYFEKGVEITEKITKLQTVFIDTLNNIPVELLQTIVRGQLRSTCLSIDESGESNNYGISSLPGSLCILLAFALNSGDSGPKFASAKSVLTTLQETLDCSKQTCLDCVMELYLLYATYNLRLDETAFAMFNDMNIQLTDDQSTVSVLKGINLLANFIDSISSMPQNTIGAETIAQYSKKESNSIVNKLPACCSFVIDKDFHAQHWYNCYTCGLANDKGCCTLCAIVCHQGHDIVYNRFSLFFCDCGGEVDNGRVRCKCLAQQARDCYLKQPKCGVKKGRKLNQILSATMCDNIVKNSFPSNGVAAVQKLSNNPLSTSWLRILFEHSKVYFTEWKARVDSSIRYMKLTSCIDLNQNIEKVDSSVGEYNMCPLKSQSHNEFAYFGEANIGSILGNTFGSPLIGKVLNGNIFDADSRGRVAVVEANNVLFVSGLDILNSKCVEKANGCNSPILQTSRIGTASIGFAVKGLKFVTDFENAIYVWGSDKAKIILMTNNFSTIATEIDLSISAITLDRGPGEIVNCKWISGSGTCMAIGYAHQIFFFDIAQQGRTIKPVLIVTSVVDDSSLLDFAVVRTSISGHSGARHWKVFASLENGKIRETNVIQEKNGLLSEIEAVSSIDALKIVSFSDDDSNDVNNSSRYRNLHYFEKSGVLLYETNVSNVTAIFLTAKGTVERVKKLLPNKFSVISLNTGDLIAVRGPYTLWKEIGITFREKEVLFRAVCVGRLENSNREVVISVEFNNNCVSVRLQDLVTKPSQKSTFTESYVGLAAFTAPMVTSDSMLSPIVCSKQCSEHVIVCALTGSGRTEVFIETAGSSPVPTLTPSCNAASYCNQYFIENVQASSKDIEHILSIVSIEDFSNVTDSNEVIFSSDELGSSDSIKKLLSIGSDNFLRCPRTSGCMITVSMAGKERSVGSMHRVQYGSYCAQPSNWVVAAVHVFVGSTPRTIPRSIKVLGKTYEIFRGVKRGYTFYLTAQEIAFAIRVGFVSIEIGQCHDCTSHPTIDVIEIYALERQKIQTWLPVVVQSVNPTATGSLSTSAHDSFRMCIQAWASYVRILGNPRISDEQVVFIQQLFAETALDGDNQIFESLSYLLSSVENDEESRHRTIDNAILSGCSTFLSKLHLSLQTTTDSDVELNWMCMSIVPAIRSCLRTAASVARLRPFNYPQVVEGSIAASAIGIVSAFLKYSVSAELVEDFVELSLLESTVANNTPLGRFGSFDGITQLLISSNKQIASKIYESISRFCNFGDIFTAQTVAVKYICDHCLRFINDIRYTVLEKEHGLDLCPKCYSLATEYAETRNKKDEVKLNGQTVGGLRALTCEEVSVMEPVPIQTIMNVAGSCSSTQHPERNSEIDNAHQNQLFNDFMDGLTTGIAGLLVDEFKKSYDVPNSLVGLAVDLIRHSINSGRKVDRGKELLSSMIEALRSRLQSASDGRKVTDCTCLLEGVICTFVQDVVARKYFLANEGFIPVSQSSNDTDVLNHVCNVHKVPVSCYKMSHGPEKDRTFIACSKEPHDRCNFFMWSDKKTDRAREESNGLFNEDTGKLVWQFLTSSSNGENPLYLALCSFVEQFTLLPPKHEESLTNVNGRALHDRFSTIQQSFYDGVFCSHERFKNNLFLQDIIELYHNSESSSLNVDSTATNLVFVEKVLEVVSLVAFPGVHNDDDIWFPVLCRLSSYDKEQNTAPNHIRQLARRCLWQLCGKETAVSVAVRDHYSFTFQLEKVLNESKKLLDLCVVLNDKAWVCLPHWRQNTTTGIKEMNIRHIVGMEGLVSEDVNTIEANGTIRGVMCEILELAEKRSVSWGRFCGLERFPAKLSQAMSDLDYEILDRPPLYALLAFACSGSVENQSLVLKIVKLALGRSSYRKPASAQMNATKGDEPTTIVGSTTNHLPIIYRNCMSAETALNVSIDDLYAFVLSFVYRGATYEIQKESLSIAKKLWSSIDKRKQGALLHQLLSGPLYSVGSMGKRSTFFLTFLQSVIGTVDASDFDIFQAISKLQNCIRAQRLATCHDKSNAEYFYLDAKHGSSAKIRRYDLAVCSHCHTNFSRIKVQKVGKSPLTSTAGFGASTTLPSPTDAVLWLPGQLSSFSRSTLDLGGEFSVTSEFCSYVALKHRSIVSILHIAIESPRRFVKTIKVYFTPRPVGEANVLKSDDFASFWQECGVVSLSRETSRTSYTLPTPVIAANLKIEYAEFHEKSTSTKTADGNIVIHCPRCRRVVSNVHGMCSSCGEVAFQCRKCRHINYERLDAFLCVECGYCASASFRYELTAAVATSAVAITNDKDYQVSLNRVKVASQLREELQSTLKWKLRDLTSHGPRTPGALSDVDSQMEAFLPLRQAFASVIPTFDEDENYSDRSHLSAKTLLSRLGSSGSIVKMIANTVNYQNVSASVPTISLFQSPVSRLDRATSTTRARLTSSGFLIRDTPTASGGDATDEASASAIASELFGGLFDSSSGDTSFAQYTAQLDVNDQLRRLLASVQSSRREAVDESVRNRSDSAATTSTTGDDVREEAPTQSQQAKSASSNNTAKKASITTKEDVGLCDKLYHRMCEVEYEMYELNRRCEAWRRLNRGCLYSTAADDATNNQLGLSMAFEPSHCSSCAPVILVHLLLLWLGLFQRDPSGVVVTTDMIVYLFDTDPILMSQQLRYNHKSSTSTYQQLQETKRTLLQQIAVRSSQGSVLVLEALRLRLLTLLQDQNAAEILGLILEAFAKVNTTTSATTTPPTTSAKEIAAINLVQPYVDLAHEALRGNISPS